MTKEEIQNSNSSKKSQLQHEIAHLRLQVNSTYGILEGFPTVEQITEMYDKIAKLQEELKNLKSE
jgi:peptidoglycan hydrolase CwlO-like protein